LLLGSTTHPGVLAQKYRGQEVHGQPALDKLLEKPLLPKRVRDFVVSEILQGNKVRKIGFAAPALRAAAPNATVEAMNFDLSSDEECGDHAAAGAAAVAKAAADAVAKAAADNLMQLWLVFDAFDPKDKKNGKKSEKRMKTFKSLYEELTGAWKSVPDAESLLPFQTLKSKGKSLKKTLLEQQSSAAA
jgi:hypothetical protein